MSIAVGYPLSYFATTKPFDKLFLRLARYQDAITAAQVINAQSMSGVTSGEAKLPSWLNNVWLTQFRSQKIKKQNQPDNESEYEYLLEFSTDTQVRVLLEEPRGVIALFGRKRSNSIPIRPENRATMQIRLKVDSRGIVTRLSIQGELKFQLPRGLVSPLVHQGDKWVPASTKNVVVALNDETIFLERGKAPKLSQPLEFAQSTIARIGKTNFIARLGQIDISGDHSKPKLQFKGIELITRHNINEVP